MFLKKICHVKIWQNEKSAITCALQNTLVETIATGLIILSDYLLNLLYFSLVWVKVLFITKNVFCFILIFASDNCCEGSVAKNLSVNIFHASLLKWISNKQQNLENLWQDCFLFLSFSSFSFEGRLFFLHWDSWEAKFSTHWQKYYFHDSFNRKSPPFCSTLINIKQKNKKNNCVTKSNT